LTAANDIPPELDPLLRQAIAWVIRLNSGAATADDAAAFELWRSRSPEHETAFRDAVRLWRNAGDVTRQLVADRRLPHEATGDRRLPRVPLTRRGLIGGAMAASVTCGYLTMRPPFGLWPSLNELSADYRTAKGEQRHVTLTSDVALTLNTQTSIAIRSSPAEPRIELIAGEAAVTAKRHDATPLVIDAAGGQISAYLATFDVKCLNDVVSVSCLDGTVDVAWKGQRLSIPAGRQVSYSASSGLGPTLAVDADQAKAWQAGLLIVRDWPVSRLVAEINRYRPGKIVVMNAGLAGRMISGTFYLDHLDDFIGQAENLFGATARSLPGGIVLLS
jgi:transmembrane sensor